MKLSFRPSQDSPLRNVDFRTTLGVVFVVMLGFGLIAPVLPLYARSFGVGYAAAGLLISIFGLVRLISQTPGGALIERFGEKSVGITGLFIVALSTLASSAAPNFQMLLVMRGLGGVGSAWFITSMYSHVLSLVDPTSAGRALSLYQGAFTAGITMGPVFGGLIAQGFGLRAPFFVYGLFCLAATGLAIRKIKPQPRSKVKLDKESRRLPRDPRFTLAVIGNIALWTTIAGSRITLVPLMADDRLNMSEAAIGGIVTAGAVASFVILGFAGRSTDRSRGFALSTGMILLALLTAAAGFATSAIVFFAITALAGAAGGYARVPVSALLADVTVGRARGRPVAVHQMAGDLGAVIGPVLAGALAQGVMFGGFGFDSVGFEGAFAAVAIPALVVGVATLFVRNTRRRTAERAALIQMSPEL